jgi:hypothetical protein
MIELAAVGLAIQGAKLAIEGIKQTAELMRGTFDEINKCVDSGKELSASMKPITKFFTLAGTYELNKTKLEEAKNTQDIAMEQGLKINNPISDAEYVMEMMAIDREIKQYYDQIKHYFIYHFDEAGLWDEFWSRLSKLRNDREEKKEAKRREETEKKLAIAAEKMKAKRKRQKIIDFCYTVTGAIVITAILYGFILAMIWIINQGGY